MLIVESVEHFGPHNKNTSLLLFPKVPVSQAIISSRLCTFFMGERYAHEFLNAKTWCCLLLANAQKKTRDRVATFYQHFFCQKT